MPAALLTSGTFRPTNAGAGDTWPAPAPAPAGGSPLSVFNGGNPNGTWSLYVVDDAAQDLGNLAGGWELTITTGAGCPAATPSPTATASASPSCPPVITQSRPDDHAAELGLVQQRVGPHGQQLLESVQHGDLRGLGLIQRDLGLLRDGTSDWSWRDATGDGASVYEQRRNVPGRDSRFADPDRDEPRSNVPGQRLGDSLHRANGGDGAGGNAQLVMEVFTPDGQAAGNLFFIGSNADAGNWTELSECGGLAGLRRRRTRRRSASRTCTLCSTSWAVACECTDTDSDAHTDADGYTADGYPNADPNGDTGNSDADTQRSRRAPTPERRRQRRRRVRPRCSKAINLSTRMRVQTGDNVGIGGFIITGTTPKHVLLRAIGPSLTRYRHRRCAG